MLVKKAKQKLRSDKDVREITFMLGQAARQIHQTMVTYQILISTREELIFIVALLSGDKIELATPIGHIVPRDHEWA